MTTSSTDPFPQLEELPPLELVGEDPTVRDARVRAAEEGRRAGFEQGLFEGRAHGEAAGREEAAARVSELLEAMGRSAEALAEQVHRVRLDLGREVVELALQIAEAVVGRQVEQGLIGGREALVRAIAEAPSEGTLHARLHPEDLAELERLGGRGDLAPGRELGLTPDPLVPRGGCIVDVGPTRVDACLEGAFDRVREVLAS